MPVFDYRLCKACTQSCGIQPVLFYQRTFQPKFPMQMHRHITIEGMYAESNTFFVEFVSPDGSQDSIIRVKQGELILINSFVYHRLLFDDNPARIFNVEFKVVPLDAVLPYSADLNSLYTYSKSFADFVDEDWDYVIISDSGDSIRHLILDIQSYCDREKGADNQDLTNRLSLQLLTAQFFLKCSSAYYDNLRDTSSDFISRIKKFISQNLDQDIRISDISVEVNMNPSYLETLFKKQTGMTVVEYINQQRILKAVSYLSSTDQSITDIGYLIGYNNRQHFSRVFRKMMGVSPGQYRKNVRLTKIQNYEDNNDPIVEGYYDNPQ